VHGPASPSIYVVSRTGRTYLPPRSRCSAHRYGWAPRTSAGSPLGPPRGSPGCRGGAWTPRRTAGAPSGTPARSGPRDGSCAGRTRTAAGPSASPPPALARAHPPTNPCRCGRRPHACSALAASPAPPPCTAPGTGGAGARAGPRTAARIARTCGPRGGGGCRPPRTTRLRRQRIGGWRGGQRFWRSPSCSVCHCDMLGCVLGWLYAELKRRWRAFIPAPGPGTWRGRAATWRKAAWQQTHGSPRPAVLSLPCLSGLRLGARQGVAASEQTLSCYTVVSCSWDSDPRRATERVKEFLLGTFIVSGRQAADNLL
jgi:hypothetical protein